LLAKFVRSASSFADRGLVRSASGDEGRNYFKGESTICLKAAVLNRPRKATFTFTFMLHLEVVNGTFPKFSTFFIQFGRKFATADVHKYLFVDFEFRKNRRSDGLSFVGA
jgi:hypothetical protein